MKLFYYFSHRVAFLVFWFIIFIGEFFSCYFCGADCREALLWAELQKIYLGSVYLTLFRGKLKPGKYQLQSIIE